ncbi:MAG: Fic family protein [Bacteroidota bacterium]
MTTATKLIQIYQSLNLNEVIDHEKFSHYAITHHSTNLEGSTLTETETQLLLDEGRTPKGKPLTHSLMAKDHYDALLFLLEGAKEKKTIDVAFIQDINARVLKNTGAVYNTSLGTIDSSKGEFRKSNVRAGNRYFVNYAKVPEYTEQFTLQLVQKLQTMDTVEEQLLLSFEAHFDLVSIHPLYDGNGRSSRLLMNFIQAYFGLPLAIVFTEDKVDYFDALEAARKQDNKKPFYDFIQSQYEKHLGAEIKRFNDMMK